MADTRQEINENNVLDLIAEQVGSLDFQALERGIETGSLWGENARLRGSGLDDVYSKAERFADPDTETADYEAFKYGAVLTYMGSFEEANEWMVEDPEDWERILEYGTRIGDTTPFETRVERAEKGEVTTRDALYLLLSYKD